MIEINAIMVWIVQIRVHIKSDFTTFFYSAGGTYIGHGYTLSVLIPRSFKLIRSSCSAPQKVFWKTHAYIVLSISSACMISIKCKYAPIRFASFLYLHATSVGVG